MDIEKLIKEFEEICGYTMRPHEFHVLNEVLVLLKKQEAVEPEKFMDEQVQRYKCRKCGKHLLYAKFAKDNYCSKCGQAVKWDD